jgi:hypothetical protein
MAAVQEIPAQDKVHLQIMDTSGSLIFEDEVLRQSKVAELIGRLSSPEGDWSLEETLFLGKDKLNDADTLNSIPDGAKLFFVTSRRTTVSWTTTEGSSAENSCCERCHHTVDLQDFKADAVVGLPMQRCIMGKACQTGSLQVGPDATEVLAFDRPTEATEALAAVPHFEDREGWSFTFLDGSRLGYNRRYSIGPLYTALDGEERRLRNLGLEHVEEDGDYGHMSGWRVPPDWAYKPY